MTEPNVSPEDVVRDALENTWDARRLDKPGDNAITRALTALDTLIAERERLREALRRIANGEWGPPSREELLYGDRTERVADAQAIARHALAAPDGSDE